MKAGQIWAKVARLTGKKDFYVRTDNFVAMVEGTLFKSTTENVVLIEGKLKVKDEKENKELILEQNKSFNFKAKIIKNMFQKENIEEAKEIQKEVTEDLKNQVAKELCLAYKDYENIINKFSKTKFDCSILYQNKEVIINTLRQINSTDDIIRLAKQYLPEEVLNNKIVQFALKSVLKKQAHFNCDRISKEDQRMTIVYY